MKLLVLLLLVLSVSADWDHFEFDITFYCNLTIPDTYFVRVNWYDVDSWTNPDLITQPATLDIPSQKYSFNMNGALDGDEIRSGGYEVRGTIDHDCNEKRTKKVVEVRLDGKCEVGSKECHYRFIMDLTDTEGIYFVKPNGFKNSREPFADFP